MKGLLMTLGDWWGVKIDCWGVPYDRDFGDVDQSINKYVERKGKVIFLERILFGLKYYVYLDIDFDTLLWSKSLFSSFDKKNAKSRLILGT